MRDRLKEIMDRIPDSTEEKVKKLKQHLKSVCDGRSIHYLNEVLHIIVNNEKKEEFKDIGNEIMQILLEEKAYPSQTELKGNVSLLLLLLLQLCKKYPKIQPPLLIASYVYSDIFFGRDQRARDFGKSYDMNKDIEESVQSLHKLFIHEKYKALAQFVADYASRRGVTPIERECFLNAMTVTRDEDFNKKMYQQLITDKAFLHGFHPKMYDADPKERSVRRILTEIKFSLDDRNDPLKMNRSLNDPSATGDLELFEEMKGVKKTEDKIAHLNKFGSMELKETIKNAITKIDPDLQLKISQVVLKAKPLGILDEKSNIFSDFKSLLTDGKDQTNDKDQKAMHGLEILFQRYQATGGQKKADAIKKHIASTLKDVKDGKTAQGDAVKNILTSLIEDKKEFNYSRGWGGRKAATKAGLSVSSFFRKGENRLSGVQEIKRLLEVYDPPASKGKKGRKI